jgi:hypothetical protein
MNTCKHCLTTENIIYSGVDALLLGATLGKTCYDCANAIRDKHKAEDEANAHLSEEQRICHSCHKTGKDTQGTYPSFYVQPWYQHADCVDWDDVRKYGKE